MNVQWLDVAPDRPVPGLEQAIDFVNTTGLSKGKPFDDLTTVEAGLAWLSSAGYLLPEDIATERARLAQDDAADGRALARLRAVRAALRDLIDAVAEERGPSDESLEAVNDVLRVPESLELVSDGARVRIARRREGRPFDAALASLARTIGNELGAGRPERFRICENDRCRWAFYDTSRPGTRRWCEMSSCGNRMKAARHRARQRAESPADGVVAPA
jgi:predicted RNA-binding Zn ribbon-like protein